jgi:hypothetical protein
MAANLRVNQLTVGSSVELFKGRVGVLVELTADKSSARVAVTRGPVAGKLKNHHC